MGCKFCNFTFLCEYLSHQLSIRGIWLHRRSLRFMQNMISWLELHIVYHKHIIMCYDPSTDHLLDKAYNIQGYH